MCHVLMSSGYPSCQLWMRCDTADYSVPKPSLPTHIRLACTRPYSMMQCSLYGHSALAETLAVCVRCLPAQSVSVLSVGERKGGRGKREFGGGGGGRDNGCGGYS